MSSLNDVNATLDTIKAMRRQEENGYVVTDYLSRIPAVKALEAPVDLTCRQMMAKWCCDITDFCDYSRETAWIALNMLDRFMASRDGQSILLVRNQFQLAAMAALYTAVKIHEHEAMDPNLVSTLSQGVHSPEAVEKMEFRMLNAIQWRVNPPTAMSFVRKMLELVPKGLIEQNEQKALMEVTQMQLDLASSDYDFCQRHASHVALSAVLNAIETVSDDGMLHADFEETLSKVMEIKLSAIRDIRVRLYEEIHGTDDDLVYMQDTYDSAHEGKRVKSFGNGSQGCIHKSPRSVSA